MSNRLSETRSFVCTTLYLSAGLLIWAANFLLTYVSAAVACARGVSQLFGIGLIPLITVLSCSIAVLANVWILRRSRSRRSMRDLQDHGSRTDDFIDSVAAALAVLSIVSVVWTGFVAAVPEDRAC